MRTSRIAGLTLAAVLASAALPAAAGPVMNSAAAFKAASQPDVVNVRWRGGYTGGAFAAGIIGGLALGAAVASQPYYGPPAYYGRPYYAPPVYYSPPAVYHYDYGYARPVYSAPYYSRDRNAAW